MRRITALIFALLALIATPAAAQVTVPHTLTDGETIDAARLNSNFAMFADALNRTGGTMTGTLTTNTVVPAATNTYDLGSTSVFYRTGHFRTSVILGQAAGNYTITWANPAAARALSIADPGGDDAFVFAAATQTLTNKTLTSPTLTAATVNTSLTVNDAFTLTKAATTAGPDLTIDSSHTAGTGYMGRVLYQLDGTSVAGWGAFEFAADKYGLGAQVFNSGGLAQRFIITGDGYVTTTSGAMGTAPSQPGFFAYNSSTDVGVATGSTIDVDTELYDRSNSFSSDTFTAPIGGDYLFCAGVRPDNGGDGIVSINLVTTAVTYSLSFDRSSGAAEVSQSGCVIANMAATDTAHLTVTAQNTPDITGGASPITWFSGRLIP